MARPREPRRDPAPATSLGSLGDLLRQRGLTAADAAPAAAAPSSPRPPADASSLAGGGKVVVRRERKGHGGKTCTVVDGLALPPADLETMARQMRKALGCGGWVDAGRIVLQGDRLPAVETWLRARGAARVVRGT